MHLMYKLNLRINIKFFSAVFDMFRIELLMSAFANFRFIKANSIFGITSLVCSILIVGLALFVIGISGWKLSFIKAIKEEHHKSKSKTSSSTDGAIYCSKELKTSIKKIPWLKN